MKDKQLRVHSTKKFLDKRPSPWEYVDEELPTISVRICANGRRTPRVRGTGGVVNAGSYWLSGTYQGTYSLRVTRVSVASGSPGALWSIRHSREGTRDQIYFPAPAQEILLGGPMEPVYAFGPGTVLAEWTVTGTAQWFYSDIEGIAK